MKGNNLVSTEEKKRRRRIPRSIAAILAGVVSTVILSIGTDLAMSAAGVYPPLNEPERFTTTLLLLATLYRSVYGIAGAYLTAILAADRPMEHALALGILGFIVSIAGAIAMWDAGHHWYPLALVALAIPCAWAGGKIHQSTKPLARV